MALSLSFSHSCYPTTGAPSIAQPHILGPLVEGVCGLPISHKQELRPAGSGLAAPKGGRTAKATIPGARAATSPTRSAAAPAKQVCEAGPSLTWC